MSCRKCAPQIESMREELSYLRKRNEELTAMLAAKSANPGLFDAIVASEALDRSQQLEPDESGEPKRDDVVPGMDVTYGQVEDAYRRRYEPEPYRVPEFIERAFEARLKEYESRFKRGDDAPQES